MNKRMYIKQSDDIGDYQREVQKGFSEENNGDNKVPQAIACNAVSNRFP
jgi:hypothetical protein